MCTSGKIPNRKINKRIPNIGIRFFVWGEITTYKKEGAFFFIMI
jgi:hypothetical protein